MEENVNNKTNDNNGNENYTSIDNTKNRKGTCPDITAQAMMEECEDMIHKITMIMKHKLVWIPWTREH